MGLSTTKKVFYASDVFYNNGLVNITEILDELGESTLLKSYALESDCLILEIYNNKEQDLYNKLLEDFIEQNDIVHQTQNDRVYWNEDRNDFIVDKKYDVEGKTSGNDVKYIYDYISPSEIGISTQELLYKFRNFAKEKALNKQLCKEIEKAFFNKNGGLKEENKKFLVLYPTKKELIKNFSYKYLLRDVKNGRLKFDSKIHPFEDGADTFRDFLKNNSNIDKWDALIYWCGVRVKRFYNASYFIYPHSQDLKALKKFKKYININDSKISVVDAETNEVKELQTNVDLSRQLTKDGIPENSNFYISGSQQEFALKLFMYLFSFIWHKEKRYENPNLEKKKKIKLEKLYNTFKKVTFVAYEEDGNFKSSLNEYTRVYRLMCFFERLIGYSLKAENVENPKNSSVEKQEGSLFKYLANIIIAIALSNRRKTEKNEKKGGKQKNLNIKSFCENLLSFKDLRKNYYIAIWEILKNENRALGKHLFEFENEYLKFTKRSDIMELHEKCRKIGRSIGYFCAAVLGEDKNLLFRLRNVKNHRQLVEFFKDFQFQVLKNIDDKEESKKNVGRIVNDDFVEMLNELEKNNSDWPIIRDYISIYAVNSYMGTSYHLNQEKKGDEQK